jgi:hypothetical protein
MFVKKGFHLLLLLNVFLAAAAQAQDTSTVAQPTVPSAF